MVSFANSVDPRAYQQRSQAPFFRRSYATNIRSAKSSSKMEEREGKAKRIAREVEVEGLDGFDF